MTRDAVIGIDPGRSKAGYALLDDAGAVVAAGIEALERLDGCVGELLARHRVGAIALGRGTNASRVRAALMHFSLPIHLVDEHETSRLARGLYFAENPPRGWRRLVPLGLQLPPRPIDDYAAILIARRFLAREDEARPLS